LQRRWSIGVAVERITRHEPGVGGSDKTNGCEDTAGSNSFPILEREYAQGILISEVVLNNKTFPESSKKLRRRQSQMMRDIKRPGEAIIKGHRSYDLMLCLQLGIR
jgi:1-phosphatidylinositol-4-phosphate 5-kinase